MSAKPLRVGVLMGGISSEHPVSLVSGTGMLNNLDPARFRGFPILISRSGEWLWPGEGAQAALKDSAEAQACLASPPTGWERVRFPEFRIFPRCDIMLIGLHGVGGEDGTLQGFLDMAGQPYTGSGMLGSALAMDKIRAKEVYRAAGIPTGRSRVLNPGEWPAARALVEREFGYPVVIKNPLGGSSIGVGIAKDAAGFDRLFPEVSRGAQRVLVEEFLTGREATCGFLANSAPLPPTEIRPVKDGFFNYEAKYQAGRTEEITPAGFPPEVIAEMQRLAALAHAALGLSVYSRTDFICTGKGPHHGLYALETNNLPGFTHTSLLPQAAAHVGLGYRDLLTKIIDESLRK